MSKYSTRASEVEPEDADDYDPSVCVCQECGAQFNGSDSSGGHCKGGRFGGCCKSFRSLAGFDKHRVGKYEPDQRRCMTDAELLAKGWSVSEGVWRLPAPAVSPWKRDT